MHIEDESDAGEERLDEQKEMKVKIPVQYHLNLHSLKVLTGKNISTAVTEAVKLYFQEVADEDMDGVPAGGDASPDT